MPITTIRALIATLAAGSIAAGCSPVESAPATESKGAAFTLCDGSTVTIDRTPDAIATGNTAALELLLRLGAGDRVIGTAWSDGAKTLPDDIRDQAARVPSLGARTADKEKLLTSGAQVYVDPYDGMVMMGVPGPSAADFAAAKMQRVVLRSSACAATQDRPVTDLGGVEDDIRSLAALVDRKPDGDRLIATMRTTVDGAPKAPSHRPSVLYLTPGRDDAQATTVGNRQIANAIISMAGGRNVFDRTDKAQFAAPWETVVATAPEVIVVAVTRQDTQAKVDAAYEAAVTTLRADPRTAGLTAVRENRFVRAFAEDMSLPGVENATMVSTLSSALNGIR
ncbi:Periplasmic binding protein OS=Tsukamurella paurometabola (strain ATCC 8368 / DSM / CCUG 35730/ CIP 100753 / JCM 10117 / KCTC 9821 / NBRC 16120 / NCIMB 702349 / NCTC 13040) OX=521096 GN=Tpau_3773 PE=4 SV=1 [Tsukamurella paurometabola]|uniref:Periplasmic binding protein n=1 Tax=Tsukamurella paurometabola (strain ATCC 8368 / DSM 20162 / CCUG 35730 / CIP 100753 / JCM 10117 / KCTC 9821 / NBRC 16120 / NCIMB 702349 / NCTC 13040) TaxID=521096 RepID=D5UYP8_TSUPD|nr:ABC transporter substrate-binding protein [Tsukamurella paurometabola]ADG80351.1 periplasmic binding protein [Tsukamurella paurometabola DSM 20162]SUP39331.1 corrinoid ABC transporter substrate-binding protein [Tsukamurella paurometabola]